MSVIGPRPKTKMFLAFPKSSQEIIKQIKPGLSGIGSIVLEMRKNLDNQNIDN